MLPQLHLARLTSWLMFGTAFGMGLYVVSNVAYTTNTQASLVSSWDRTHVSPGKEQFAAEDSSFTFGGIIGRPRLAYGQPLAKIVVPSIKFSGVVLEGTDDRVLAGGPGHVPETAYPGEPDNMVISNHNTYSLAWGDVKKGDSIEIETNYGKFLYRVTGFRIVDAKDQTVALSPTPRRGMLSFVTCYPLWAGALAHQRYVVLADLVQ
ncbi:MAG: class D sortase [Candidatus Dormibacteria bacterium]